MVHSRIAPDLGSLPDPPLALVLKHLERLGGLEELLSFRLVSKKFKEACAGYNVVDRISVKSLIALDSVTRALPGLLQLSVSCDREKFPRSPLAKCSRLTHLRSLRVGSLRRHDLMDFKSLPETIQRLNICYVFPLPASSRPERFVELTSLQFTWSASFPAWLCDFLLPLPQLQALNVTLWGSCHYKGADNFSVFLRCQHLTRLVLNDGVMLAPTSVAVQATALQTLELCKMKTNAAWLHQACSFMPHLMKLILEDCTCDVDASPALPYPPLRGLRRCLLLECDPTLYNVLGPFVETVYCTRQDPPLRNEEAAVSLNLARLRAVTELEMSNYDIQRHVNPVLDSTASANLRRLLIHDFSHMSALSLKPDRLTALRHLRIGRKLGHDNGSLRRFQSMLANADSQQNSELVAHRQVRDAVLKLPRLTTISGEGAAEFFQLANAEGLEGFRKVSKCKRSEWAEGNILEVWRKVKKKKMKN